MVLFAAGTLAVPAHGSQQAGDKKPSTTWQMRCIVRVTGDADILPLNFELIESLLRSDAVAGDAARDTWPKGHGSTDACFEIRPLESPDFTPPQTVGPFLMETRTILFALHVHLDNGVGPVAREFGNALIENLRAELEKAFAIRTEELKKQLTDAENRRRTIREEYEDLLRQGTFASMQPIQLDEADEVIHKQLQKVVDLSALTPNTPVNEAFDILAHSVAPPLNLVVIWRDLFDNANIEPSSPAQMDGPASIQLGIALQNLLAALTDPLADSHNYYVNYMVGGGTVTVATRVGLPAKKVETRMYNLPPLLRMGNQAPELAALIRETIEPSSWHNPYLGSDNGTLRASADGRLIVCQSRDVHIKIQELLAKVASEVAFALPSEAPPERLAERLESLLGYREQLEQELDRLQERQGQLARERSEERRKAADTDLGWGIPLSRGTEENTVAERVAAKQSDLREVSRRIAETQRMMAGSKTFDPELSGIEWTARRCEQADARIHNLKTRIENLQPCTVTVIGGTR
jgi:hypothetical protein